MTSGWREALLLVVGFGLAACAMVAMPSRWRRRLAVTNHRGQSVPATLGTALFVASVGAQGVAVAAAAAWGPPLGRITWYLLPASALVFVAGLLDDLLPGGPRGLGGHLRALFRGRLTTGIVKAVAAVLAAAAVVLAAPHRPGTVGLLGVVLMAGTANLLNGLDVVPGRAGKAFLMPAVVLMFLGPPALLVRLAGAELAALWPDLRERAMLGDGGANLLGFVLGAGLYLELSDAGVMAAAALVVAMNLLAETITLSRAIRAIPPLRWIDGAGRLPQTGHEPDAAPAETVGTH